MKVKFNISCMGYSVGGHNNYFELEIEEWELEGMTKDEKEEYIEHTINEYIMEELDFGYHRE